VLTLFEHEAKPFDWTDADLSVCERLRQQLGADVLRPSYVGRQRSLQAGQFVGVVRLGTRTVQVLPKTHRNTPGLSDQDRTRDATRNLLCLLEQAGEVQIKEQALAPLLRLDADWFEVLTWLFASHLLSEWRHGPVRRYEVQEEVLPVLRGSLQLTAQLRRPERKHLFAVAYDEFTPDNRLNQVLRFVVERLWRLTRDPMNRQTLGSLREWMEEVSLPASVRAGDASPQLLTRLHRRYEPVLNLARLFLDGGALQLAAGDLTSFAFVFDMNQLFEAFVVGFVQRHRDQVLTRPELRRCDLLPQTCGAVQHLARRAPGGQPVFPLYPDLTFRSGAVSELIVDTKYKRLDPESRRLGVSPADFYQMFAYAHRYDCSRVLLLYPQTAEMDEPLEASFNVEGTAKIITAATLSLSGELWKPTYRQALVGRLRDLLN
jgi:5-methylcytosine-specific restriction enzyme subunit McrC